MSTSIRIFFLIQQLNRLVVSRIDETLNAENITARQFLLLDLLSNHEPCSSAELARRAHMTAQAMGESVKALEQRGLLEKMASENDARALRIQRTPLGWETFMRCSEAVNKAEEEFFSCLASSEVARLRGSLALVREIAIDALRSAEN
ncbi:DNA-binding MarR family transcriptional regulator [Paraburkholderia youngii]|uniref:MarR family winged helix-turn-helix transcriptional regulator n=1 Tax=Paraburkholderia TaxID=1822464 RepID=UPI0034CDE7D0